MGRKQLAVLIAIVTVIGGIPAVGAEHLSVGYEDAPGVSPDDEDANSPSVEAEDRARGTTEECFEAEGENLSEVQQAQEADPFCGKLLYQWDTELSQESPPDQDLKSTDGGTEELDIGTFNVRTTRSYMVAHEARLLREDVGACTPFCQDQPADSGNTLWDAVHEAGSAAGLTETPDDARENNNEDRYQAAGADVHTPTARYLIEDAHEMNGWSPPGLTRSFVAFLYDDGGDPIDDDDLEAALSDNPDLHPDAKPTVCGFTPDADFVGSGGATTCEVPFGWSGTDEGANDDFTDGYDNKCNSPTYVCGATAGGAWYADFDLLTPLGAGESGYMTWHFVVAPTLPDCGVREPGFLTSLDSFSDKDVQPEEPYLAHDVDVYTNPFAIEGAQQAHTIPTMAGAAQAYANNQVPDDVTETPDVPGADEYAPDTDAVIKGDRVEPNAKDVGDLSDTSQSLPETNPSLDRSLGDPCEQLTGSETEDTVDPWVDIVDGEVTSPDQVNSAETVGTVGPTVDTEGFGLYGNEGEQDNDNNPGPNLYRTDGNVGMFTDKNDNGEYDTVVGDSVSFTPDKTNGDTIEATGAYPMLWDIWVDDDLEIDPSSGCTISGSSLPGAAEATGYGPETGLWQLVYLNEPTVFVDDSTGEAIPYPGGDNIYLFLSQSARQHYEDGSGTLAAEIDNAISELKAYTGAEGEVVQPGQELGYDSDYQAQCTEDTGGFTLQFNFAHNCQTDCSQDTIVTGYTFQLTQPTITGDGFLPPSTILGDDFTFGEGTHTWTDVDPFDNDPSREDDTDDSPPTGGE